MNRQQQKLLRWRYYCRRFIMALMIVVMVELSIPAWIVYQDYRFNSIKADAQMILTDWVNVHENRMYADFKSWTCSDNLLQTFDDICLGPEVISIAEFQLLHADMLKENQHPVTIETLNWFRQRLAKTGPHGDRYISRTQSLWDQMCDQ